MEMSNKIIGLRYSWERPKSPTHTCVEVLCWKEGLKYLDQTKNFRVPEFKFEDPED